MAPNCTQRQQVTFLRVTSFFCHASFCIVTILLFCFSACSTVCVSQCQPPTASVNTHARLASNTEAMTIVCVFECVRLSSVWITDKFSRSSWRDLFKYNLVLYANMLLLTVSTWMPLLIGINTKKVHIWAVFIEQNLKVLFSVFWLIEIHRGLTVWSFCCFILYIFCLQD